MVVISYNSFKCNILHQLDLTQSLERFADVASFSARDEGTIPSRGLAVNRLLAESRGRSFVRQLFEKSIRLQSSEAFFARKRILRIAKKILEEKIRNFVDCVMLLFLECVG